MAGKSSGTSNGQETSDNHILDSGSPGFLFMVWVSVNGFSQQSPCEAHCRVQDYNLVAELRLCKWLLQICSVSFIGGIAHLAPIIIIMVISPLKLCAFLLNSLAKVTVTTEFLSCLGRVGGRGGGGGRGTSWNIT